MRIAIVGGGIGGLTTALALKEFGFEAEVYEQAPVLLDVGAAIAEQHRLHAERDVAHQRLITVLQQSPVPIGIAEAPTGRFIFLNEEAERVIGYRPEVIQAANPLGPGLKGLHPDGRELASHEWPLARALRARAQTLAIDIGE